MGFFGGGKKPDSKPDQSGQHRAVSVPGAYGIDDAIRLMRTLPAEQNADLVVRVVKNTLESVNVHVSDIIQDATVKEKALRERAAALHQQITELEGEIAKRRDEIFRIEADLDETMNVRELLQRVEAEHAAAPPAAGEGDPDRS